MEVSLKPNSEYKEIQNLYKAGFTNEQIVALAQFICAVQNQDFHLVNKEFEHLLP